MKTNKTLFGALFLLIVLSARAQTTHYVSPFGGHIPPFNTWQNAATNIQAAVDVSTNGDSVLVTNGIYNTGGTLVPGNFLTNRVYITNAIILKSVNGPAVTMISGVGTAGAGYTNNVRCVYLATNTVVSGFTLSNGITWWPYGGGNNGGPSDLDGGGVVGGIVTNCTLVSNRAYGGGGGANGSTIYNCTLLFNISFYQSGGAQNCHLNNCTLTGNQSENYDGGGADGCVLNNCVVTGNIAVNHGGGAADSILTNCLLSDNIVGFQNGGGAYNCTLVNCRIMGNSAQVGGGASDCTLNNCLICYNSAMAGGGVGNGPGGTNMLVNCTVVSNTASYAGGGAVGAVFTNSIILNNTAPDSSSNYGGCTLSYSCSMPLAAGPGNIARDPLFVDYAGGNFRLQSNSPCINSGNNAFVGGSTDLDGRTRIVGGTVDMGCYEFQGLGVGEFTFWLQQYSLATDGSADYADPDGDGMNNWQEWIVGTNPTNGLSVLKMLALVKTNNPAGMVVTWQSVNTRTYFLQSSTNLAVQPFSTIQSNIAGQATISAVIDTNATGSGSYFYHVGVQ